MMAKLVVYGFAGCMTALVGALCFERDQNGQWVPNDDPPVQAIAILGGAAMMALGIQIPLEDVAKVLHLKGEDDKNVGT